jgi:maleylpyruvate isomerase
LEIHTADADLGYGSQAWSVPLCTHLVGFLAPRVPEGFRVTLSATDTDFTLSYGSGAPLSVAGRLTDLAAWLAGRIPPGPLEGSLLPPLGSWP